MKNKNLFKFYQIIYTTQLSVFLCMYMCPLFSYADYAGFVTLVSFITLVSRHLLWTLWTLTMDPLDKNFGHFGHLLWTLWILSLDFVSAQTLPCLLYQQGLYILIKHVCPFLLRGLRGNRSSSQSKEKNNIYHSTTYAQCF